MNSMNYELLKKAREALNITRQEAAEKLNISVRTYEKYELGTSKPRSIEMYVKMAKLFKMSLDWWFEHEDYLTLNEAEILTQIRQLSDEDRAVIEHIIRKMNQ